MSAIREATVIEIKLTDARRHDVGHCVRLVHSIQHCRRRVAKPQHPVTSTVVYDGTLQRNDPGAGCGNGSVRTKGVCRIEVCQALLHTKNLLTLVKHQQISMRFLEFDEHIVAAIDGYHELCTFRQKVQDDLVSEASGYISTSVIPHFLQASESRLPVP
jgi:hypothetical protein